MAKNPDEIPFQPEKPTIMPPIEPAEPQWPKHDPEIKPEKEPVPDTEPKREIPAPSVVVYFPLFTGQAGFKGGMMRLKNSI